MDKKRTRVHYLVITVVCLLYFITYLDRVNFSVAAPTISKHFGIGKVELGSLFSAFSIAYVLFQIPIGSLGDRIGPRKILTLIVAFWSIFDIFTGFAWSFRSLLMARFALGVGESAAFPSATRAFANWIPKTERGFAQGVTHAFSRLGGAVTPVIVVAIIARYDWRAVFYISGGIAFVWALLWFWWYRNTPAEYQKKWGGINANERAFIEESMVVKKKTSKISFLTLIKSRNVWPLCVSYFCYCYGLWIYLTWLPTYLVEARGFAIIKMGIFASLPLMAGMFGDVLGGWLSDKIWARTGKGTFARRSVAMGGLLMAMCFIVPAGMTGSADWAIFFLCMSLFGLEMSVGVYWAVCLDIGQENAGSVSSLMNCVGCIGSFVSPFLFGVIVEYTGSWTYPFILAGVVLLVGALLWLKTDPELTVSEELGLGNLADTPLSQGSPLPAHLKI